MLSAFCLLCLTLNARTIRHEINSHRIDTFVFRLPLPFLTLGDFATNIWLKLVTFAISEFSVTPITFYHLQSSYFTFATYISNLSLRNSFLSRDGGKPTYYWYPSFTCAMALIVIARQRFSAYWLKSKQWNKLAVLFHWSKCLVLDAGTVLISVPPLIVDLCRFCVLSLRREVGGVGQYTRQR